MKRFLLVVFCMLAFPVMASHIVGGEFEIVHLSGNLYRINLILYFDDRNGSEGAFDRNIEARIFRKRDNAIMMDVTLPSTSREPVSYTQPACSDGSLKTDKITYTTTITLAANSFNDPQGYYISWERCCRNYLITNVISRQPPPRSVYYADAAGQTFYLEFPPVVKNGQPFINSTPRLFPPLSDYACPNKPYYADFGGTDDDGDSLVYSMVTPLNTHTAEAVPADGPGPAPYPDVRWQSGFSLNNMMLGAPDLRISRDGMLTVTPTTAGLFVFAVKCEEFRDGIKIGELRRDFQMLVVGECPTAVPPVVVGKAKTAPNFTQPDEPLAVHFANTVSDADRCIDVRISDQDAFNQGDNNQEKIRIKAIPIGFTADISGISLSVTTATLTPDNPYVDLSVCFDKCPYGNGPFQIGIVAYDDACSLPWMDTLRVTVTIELPPNQRPEFLTADVAKTVTEGVPVPPWSIQGVDADNHSLVLAAGSPDAFAMAKYGFALSFVKNVPGSLEYTLTWNTDCRVSDFSEKTHFDLKFLLDDHDVCQVAGPDTLTFLLDVVLPPNARPLIDSDLQPGSEFITVTKKINEQLAFLVHGTDADNDPLLLSMRGVDFNASSLNIQFPGDNRNGYVESQFVWDIRCAGLDLAQKDEYQFLFQVLDNRNKCKIPQADLLTVTVNLLPPDNQGPALSVVSLDENMPMVNGSLAVTLGQQITLGLNGTDADNFPEPDLLKLELVEANGSVPPEGYIFSNTEGRGNVQTTFTWKPECNIFRNGVYENDYSFIFRVIDDRCFSEKGDTVTVNMRIKDVESNASEFLPPNFISPNGDGLNDFFAMVKLDETTGELVSILPKDNCAGRFERMDIFNRWGNTVFETTNRDFRWYALEEASGMYFYTLKYSNKQYKGIITVSYGDSQSNR